MDKIIIGRNEICDLSELGISDLEVRIDTGAKTSSLHVDNIQRYKKDGKPWIKFDIHPDIHNVDSIVECTSPLVDIRRVKSSNGTVEERYVIKTKISLGSKTWPAEITLTDRSDMTYLMLMGREAMGKKFLVDPSRAYILSK